MAKKGTISGVNAGGTQAMKEVVRVTFRFHGAELQQIREVQEMLSLNSEVDAARHLILRGLEAMMPVLMSRRAQTKMAQSVNPDQIVQAMGAKNLDFAKLFQGMEEKEKG